MGNRHEPEEIQVGLRHAKGSQAHLEEKQTETHGPVVLYLSEWQTSEPQLHSYGGGWQARSHMPVVHESGNCLYGGGMLLSWVCDPRIPLWRIYSTSAYLCLCEVTHT